MQPKSLRNLLVRVLCSFLVLNFSSEQFLMADKVWCWCFSARSWKVDTSTLGAIEEVMVWLMMTWIPRITKRKMIDVFNEYTVYHINNMIAYHYHYHIISILRHWLWSYLSQLFAFQKRSPFRVQIVFILNDSSSEEWKVEDAEPNGSLMVSFRKETGSFPTEAWWLEVWIR